jgi:hypothetical protein
VPLASILLQRFCISTGLTVLRGRQEPAIAERTGHHARAIAIERVLHRPHQGGARLDGTVDRLVGIGHLDVEHHGGAADRRRAHGAEGRMLVVHHQDAVADPDLRMAEPARWIGQAKRFNGAEGLGIEGDRLLGVMHRYVGLHGVLVGSLCVHGVTCVILRYVS